MLSNIKLLIWFMTTLDYTRIVVMRAGRNVVTYGQSTSYAVRLRSKDQQSRVRRPLMNGIRMRIRLLLEEAQGTADTAHSSLWRFSP